MSKSTPLLSYSRTRRCRARAALVVAALSLAIVPAAYAAPAQDLRSPDARDAANGAGGPRQDLRSPDARDAANGAGASQDRHSPSAVEAARGAIRGVTPQPVQDLRSPDARDAAAPRRGSFALAVQTPASPRTSAAPSDGGVDGGDAAIAAGVLLGLILLGLAGAQSVGRVPRPPTAVS